MCANKHWCYSFAFHIRKCGVYVLRELIFKNFFKLFLFQRGCDSYMVYLFDKSKTVYEGPFASRSLSDCVNYIGKYSSFTDWGLNLK